MTGLHVALVGPGFPPQDGGIGLVLGRMADGLASLGCRVEVLVQYRQDEGPLPSESVLPSGVVVRRFASISRSRRFPFAPSLASYLRRHGDSYDVVHGHSFHAIPAPIAAVLCRGPFVFSPHYHGGGHTPLARLAHRPYRPLGMRAFARASVVLANTRFEGELIRRDFGSCGHKVRVLHHGIDAEVLRSAEPYVVEQPVVLMAGRLEDYKQPQLALRALALVNSPFRAVVLGAGPMKTDLEQLARDLSLTERVAFLGHVPGEELNRWHRTASVFLSLSRHESFGLGMLEAIVAGAHVVSTDLPPSIEIAQMTGAAVRFVRVDADPACVAGQIEAALHDGSAAGPVLQPPSWLSRAEESLALYLEACAATRPVAV
jgi:glycosyltransferase involved in cell wall biosynthesis